MKLRNLKLSFFTLFMTMGQLAFAQTDGEGQNYLLYALLAVVLFLVFLMLIQVADNFMAIEAKQNGVTTKTDNLSIFPSWSDLFAPKLPDYAQGDSITVLKKGHDILLEGEPDPSGISMASTDTFAIQPPNFIGISPIPKVTVEVGEKIKAGDTLFFDKKKPGIKYASPVSGEVVSIDRGEKRSIAQVVVRADKDMEYRQFDAFDLEEGSRVALVEYLMESGVWPMIRQRPFDVVPDVNDIPRDIFISTFDTAPLAPDLNIVVEGQESSFQKGLDVLAKLTEGDVHLGLSANGETAPATAFTEATGVKKHWFSGKHPAGNVGVQIHHIQPITANSKVWTLGVQEVITIGTLFTKNIFDASRIVAIGGAEVTEPAYVKTYQGAKIGDLLRGKTENTNIRRISGDVLSGKKKEDSDFLNFHDDQVTVIEEGDYYEMFGWLIPVTPRPSVSNTFPNFLFPDLKFAGDTNTHGEERAFVVTGQYEKVLPMDIYPQHLMKSILVNDFERMEGLGIYELSEEDIALCEFVCTSKQPLQDILRSGLNVIREQS